MKTRLPTLLIALIGTLLLSALIQARIPLTLEFPPSIEAGEAWSLNLTIDTAQAGEVAEVTLFHGLRRLNADLLLGTGGVAVWTIDEGILTQAGSSLLWVRYGDFSLRERLMVVPGPPAEADFFATGNAIAAYGDQSAMLLALARDAWGNLIDPALGVNATVVFPNGTTKHLALENTGGLRYAEMPSQGPPGRVRIRLDDPLSAAFELQQLPSYAAQIALDITPDCVLGDGRDLITLTADVRDRYDSPVIDGTLVRFVWAGGGGQAMTMEGLARLRLPAPKRLGEHLFYAAVGSVESAQVTLRVSESGCG